MFYLKLKKVEIKGFKSFAYKTEIRIKDGITAIVGPNGSGKSNISDAVRWVLGEQSIKNLRGHKMEDVIFAGTSKRKALGYCEATISFDNKSGLIPVEYDEVEVTRRMFRSGESQYFLNKSSCRLKDIREIFMDTGVGKDGYSIIGQGRIEEILSNKPEDRRSIFEEAAGIVKYKSKKTQAERKLDKTEENLIRIKDLTHELSKQETLLKGQADRAKEFEELYRELKKIEVNLLVAEIKKNREEEKKINGDRTDMEGELESLVREAQLIQEDFNKLRDSIGELDREIDESRAVNLDLGRRLEEGKNELAIENEKESFHRKDLERLKNEKTNIETRIENTKKRSSEIDLEIRSISGIYQEKLEIYEKTKGKFKDETDYLKKKEKEIEDRKDNLLNLYNESSSIKSKINTINSFDENIKKRGKKLEEDIGALEGERDRNKKLLEEALEKRESSIEKLAKLKDGVRDLRLELEKSQESLKSLSGEINQSKLQKESKSSSLRILQSMEDGYEGYYKGVKSVLIESKKNPSLGNGLVGVVAEMIKLEPSYEKAIEIALGSRGQNIVTEDENSAKNIIEFLKKNRLGRVTCLPASVIKGRDLHISQADRDKYNILGLGHELIEYDKEYEDIFKYLLGRTLVIETIDDGIAFARASGHAHRIVTLEGEILNPGGSMTGGSQGGSGVNIINRKNRIEELENNIEEIDDLLRTKGLKEEAYRKDIRALETSLGKEEEELKQLEYRIYSIDNNIENYKEEGTRVESILLRSKREILDLREEEENYSREYEGLKGDLDSVDKKSLAEKEEIQALIQAFNLEKDEKEGKSQSITDLKLEINSIENKIRNLRDREESLDGERRDLLEELGEKEKTIEKNKEEIDRIQRIKEKLHKSIEDLGEDLKSKEELLSNLVEEKNGTMNKFYEEQENLTNLNKLVGEREKKINRLEVKLARISTQLDNYEARLYDEYELSFQEALGDAVELEDKKLAGERIKKLKLSIKALGHINLAAIEEYQELSERLEFIRAQKDDLSQSKENLNEIIQDMEKKMKVQFLDSFEKINRNFIQVFKTLFNGGKAELVLEDRDDVLNTGIQINAQPPGKKLQNLSLLSGGEKSLTAVALLFSILNLKPAPFCILDEIDAALDEANIGKYTSYLKNFAHDTQFVLITHRKKTMEIADHLYGVTMEEEGISKLISVKLKDYVEEIAS